MWTSIEYTLIVGEYVFSSEVSREMECPSSAAMAAISSQSFGKSSLSMILYMWTVPPLLRWDNASGRNLSAICGRFMMMRSAIGRIGTTTVASPVIGSSTSQWLSFLFISAKRSASGFRSIEYTADGFAALQICTPKGATPANMSMTTSPSLTWEAILCLSPASLGLK